MVFHSLLVSNCNSSSVSEYTYFARKITDCFKVDKTNTQEKKNRVVEFFWIPEKFN